MFRFLLFILLILVFGISQAQEPVLQEYINTGLAENLALKQKEFSLEKSIAALKEARGMFLPSLQIHARYTRAGGGREIEFPIGDLMNPVYGSINQILTSLGQPTQPFPVLKNEIIPFLREEEHETKLQLIQPVFQPAIYYNYKIKSQLLSGTKYEKQVYTRQLVQDIKTAYFNYLKTLSRLSGLDSTEKLLEENVRVSQKLVENDLATIEIEYRAKAELAGFQSQKEETRKAKILTSSYFNFLLNRPLDTPIAEISPDVIMESETLLPEVAESIALENREEIEQINAYTLAADHGIGLNKSKYLPGIVLAADYGFQGEKYNFNPDEDFWMASAVLQWNLFNGFQDEARTEQAKLDLRQMQLQQEMIKKSIIMEVREAVTNLSVKEKSLLAAKEQLLSARKAFEIIQKKYNQGMSSQLEFLDARKNMTTAETEQINFTYEFYICKAKLERVTASYPLNSINAE